jgi:dienelactone hydrolase
VREQRADLLHAVAYARRAERLDPERIALWGTSLGGSHVVEHAARDARIAALVLNMPALDALQGGNLAEKLRRTGTSRPRAVAAAARLLGAAVLDAVRGALGRSPYYVAVYGAPGQAFFADESLAGRFAAVAAGSPTWQNRVAPRFLFQVPRYREGTMEKIAAPILVTLAADDVEVSGTFVRAKVSKARRVEIREYAGGHFDLYHGPLFEQVVAEQTAFLRAHLA